MRLTRRFFLPNTFDVSLRADRREVGSVSWPRSVTMKEVSERGLLVGWSCAGRGGAGARAFIMLGEAFPSLRKSPRDGGGFGRASGGLDAELALNGSEPLLERRMVVVEVNVPFLREVGVDLVGESVEGRGQRINFALDLGELFVHVGKAGIDGRQNVVEG